MEFTTKNRWKIGVAASVIFLLGFLAGILALNIYRAWARRNVPTREDRFAQLADRLQLNSEQKPKVQQIFNDTREQLRGLRKESEPRVGEIRRQTEERLEQTLRPEQWQRFQELRKEMRGPGRRSRGGGPDKP